MKFLGLILLFLFPAVFAAGPRPQLPKPYLVAPIVLDGQAIQEAWVFPRDNPREFAIEAEPVLQGLKSQIQDRLLQQLQSKVRSNGTLTLQDLVGAGLTANFDEASLVLNLQLPLKYRKSTEVNLSYDHGDFDHDHLRPTVQSGYFNVRTNQSYLYGTTGQSDQFLPFTGHVELVENINGVVFEGLADYLENNAYPWKRGDTRFRYDDEERMLRYTLGDLNVRTQGFQASPQMGGLSVMREFAIQPYRTLRPLNSTEVQIKRPSLLQIYINGFLFSEMRVQPGVFNLRDFPLAMGQSDVKIKIRDDLGQEETYDFSALFENSLLPKGVQEFSYNAGLPWLEAGADRAYYDSGVFSDFYHRVGITDQLTAGVNFQNYLTNSLAGMEISGVTRLGYLSAETAYSTQNSTEYSGYAERFRYRTLNQMLGKEMPVTVALEIENRDQDFNSINPFAVTTSNYLRRYDGQINFRPTVFWNFGVGMSYQQNVLGADQRTSRANLTLPLTLNSRLDVSYNRIVASNTDEVMLLSFNWMESAGHYSVSSFYEAKEGSVGVSLNRTPQYTYDDFRVTASAQNSGDMTFGNIAGEYLTQPASFRVENYSSTQAGSNRNVASVGINTGFAWVGSHGAFTQPVNDSFVLLQSKNLPENQIVIVNPRGDKGDAQLGPRQSTVLNNETAYYKYLVSIDSTSLPVGYLLDKEFYNVQPTYRSGVYIPLNIQRKIMVKGRLQLKSNKPLSFAAGDVLDQTGKLVDNSFFTNKDGGFMIEGLSPGQYKIVTDQPDLKAVIIDVKDTSGNRLDLGTITLEKEGDK